MCTENFVDQSAMCVDINTENFVDQSAMCVDINTENFFDQSAMCVDINVEKSVQLDVDVGVITSVPIDVSVCSLLGRICASTNASGNMNETPQITDKNIKLHIVTDIKVKGDDTQ